LTEDGKFVEDREGFLPFGLGLRRCPGEDLAQLEMFLIITNLLKDFHFSVPQGIMSKHFTNKFFEPHFYLYSSF